MTPHACPCPTPRHQTRNIPYKTPNHHLITPTLCTSKSSPQARAGSKGRRLRAVLSEWHTDLLDLLIALGCWCPPSAHLGQGAWRERDGGEALPFPSSLSPRPGWNGSK